MLGKVLVIAPYKGLATLVGRMARQREDLDITVRTADLEEALPLLDWARDKSFDLIISRGGTASLLEAAGTLPVVEISVSGYDLFRLTSFIKDYSGRVSLIGFPNVCAGVATFSSYLNVEIPYAVVHNQDDVDQAIQKARADGRVVIGDTVTVRKAEESGLKGLLISSGPESVTLAFDMAANMLRGLERMRDRQRVVEQSLITLGRNTTLCDPDGNLVALPQSTPLTGTRQRWRDLLLPLFASHRTLSEGPFILRNGPLSAPETDIAVAAPKIDGRRYLVFHDADVVGRRPVRHLLIDSVPVTLFQIIADGHHLAEPAQKARQLLAGFGPVCLVGAPGTGRTRMLRAIQTALYGPQSRLLWGMEVLHGNREALRQVLDGLAASTGMLAHVAGVERLKRVDQERLAQELVSYGHGVVLLFLESPATLVAQGVLSPAIMALIKGRKIALPLVGADPQVFESAVLYHLMEANGTYGKNVRKLSPQALESLRTRPWPRNFEDLARFIDRLVRDAPDGDHVITDIPAPMRAVVSKRNSLAESLPLEGTLAEMEAQIIEMVLAQEGGNQSAAAARLGIGRTTLWRKVQRSK
jgi:hypothetical protein